MCASVAIPSFPFQISDPIGAMSLDTEDRTNVRICQVSYLSMRANALNDLTANKCSDTVEGAAESAARWRACPTCGVGSPVLGSAGEC